MTRAYKSLPCLVLLLAPLPEFAKLARAGGGPENVMLVVNELSDDSKTIANHYIRLRNIPPQNVVRLAWRGSQSNCTVERFRKDLLVPVINAINQRKLSLQIDYLIYSAGFPYRIDLKPDHPKRQFSKELRPVASLTGATYLWQYVISRNPSIVLPGANWYVPRVAGSNLTRCAKLDGVRTQGFRGRYAWAEGGRRAQPKKGARFFLSTMLGVTVGRGNTVEEVIAYLNRSAAADHTHPDGTFYFAKNNDIRSTTRHNCYAGVVRALQAEGARAKVVQGTTPTGASDIAGFTVGTRKSDLAAAGARVMPGAICEHFTSYGGDFRKQASQMPLTDFLRIGAAGASGTVVEPRAIQAKFPLPSVHLHYRRGCSLAEAFYQSVAGPYQLLIVGDPLCQPWAKPPKLVVDGIKPGQTVSGAVSFTPRINPGMLTPTRPCEIFIDGRLYAPAPTDKPLTLNTTKLSEGHHELRIVAIAPDAIESQSRVVLPFSVNNRPRSSLHLTATPIARGNARSSGAGQDWIELKATVSLAPQPPANKPPADKPPASNSKADSATANQLPAYGDPADGEPASQRREAEVANKQQSGAAAEAQAEAPAAPAKAEPPKIVFLHDSKVLGRVTFEGDAATGKPWVATLRVRSDKLGSGPVRLQARVSHEGIHNGMQSPPVWWNAPSSGL